MATQPNFTRLTTVAVVMTNLMTELGLTVPVSFVGSSDATVQQLLVMLSSAGKDLCGMHDWETLHKEWTFTVTPGTTNYNLPADWNGFSPGAAFDNTARWPMVGSIPPVVWRILKGRLSAGNPLIITYKVMGNQLVLFSAPSADSIVLDYYSRGWLQDASDPTVYRDNVQNDSDTILLASRLVEALVKVRWRASKGFDTVEAVQSFNDVFDLITGRDSPGPTLSIGQNPVDALINYGNIPDTNYGG